MFVFSTSGIVEYRKLDVGVKHHGNVHCELEIVLDLQIHPIVLGYAHIWYSKHYLPLVVVDLRELYLLVQVIGYAPCLALPTQNKVYPDLPEFDIVREFPSYR